MTIKKYLTSLLALALPVIGQAFTVTNHTDYSINITLNNDRWWFSVSETIPGQTQWFEYAIDLKPETGSYFTIKVKTPDKKHPINDTWKIYGRSDLHLDFEISAEGHLQIFANKAQIW